MPDKPNYHKREHPIGRLHASGVSEPDRNGRSAESAKTIGRTRRFAGAIGRYAELRCKSNFSFLRGASHPEELAEQAAHLGYAALAITDENTLAGVVRMHCAAKACQLQLIVGAEITPVDAPSILLYAADRTGYAGLCRIITEGRLRSQKGDCAVTLEDIERWSKGLIAAIDGNSVRDCRLSIVECRLKESFFHSIRQSTVANRQSIYHYRDIFGDRLYWAVSVHGGPEDGQRIVEAEALAGAIGVPLIATNDVHYHEPQRRFLQDILTCIREHCTLEGAGQRLFINAERHLKSVEEMHRLFADHPQAVARTVELAERCCFTLDELRYEYPEALCPPGRRPDEFLAELTWAGATERYPGGIPDKIRTLIEHELMLVRKLNYEPYFLTVWDIVQFARSRGILCQGRGSAANSAVCYCLGITNVDPDRIDLLFERFVSAERNEPPDIDVDFEHERREEVFQYIYDKYGRDHAGIVAEVITYRPRSAIRDVGKALGLSLDRVAALAKQHDWWDRVAMKEEFIRATGVDPSDRTIRMLARLVRQIIGFPRHLSQHVGGFVITRGPLCEMVPIENAAMPDRTFIEWDKDDIDALGILKVDCLALGMLTAIGKCLRLPKYCQLPIADCQLEVRASHSAIGNWQSEIGNPVAPSSLSDIPPEDPLVYDMICRADTIGVFQIESRAQMSMLPRLRPRNFYDLVIEVAIVRPGPIQGGMVHPYLRRRNGEEPVVYPSAAIRGVLERTLGVPLFQEQAMRLAIVAAGFTPGEADQLRRAMAAWRRGGQIERFREKLITGMLQSGLSQEFAERCFEQIRGFGEYGFPESHAASFALLVYVSAWLKRYHPAAFCAAILNSQPMGFYQPAQLVRDAREHGVSVLPIDVNFSGYDCRMEMNDCQLSIVDCRLEASRLDPPIDNPSTWGVVGPALRLGMRLVKGISAAQVEGIEQARRDEPFASIADLSRRSGAARATLARLAAADAMRSFGLSRREAVWKVLSLSDEPPLFEGVEPDEPPPPLPQPSLTDVVMADYDKIGLSLTAHPLSLLRAELAGIKARPNEALKTARQGQWMKVAGLVLVRQRPTTARGITFFTIEDETAAANLIVRPQIFEKYRQAARGAAILVAEGRVEREGEVVHLQVSRIMDASRALRELRGISRDFH